MFYRLIDLGVCEIKVWRLQEVANFVSAEFSNKIKKLAKEKCEFNTFFAIF